jgi:large subunit ribosomal protein L7/L12
MDVRGLDVGPLDADLESFVRDLAASAAPRDEVVLPRARLLLMRLRKRPPAGEAGHGVPVGLPDAVGPDGWQAIGAGDASGRHEVTCWKGAAGAEAMLHGEWRGDELELTYVAVGERFWASRQTPDGESRASTDSTSEGPADRRLFTDIPRRAREEMETWNEATAVRRWHCPRCSWQNQDDALACAVCGTPRTKTVGGDGARDPWPVGSDLGIPDDPHPGEPPRGRPSDVLEEPPNLSEALEDLVRDVAEDVARDVADELREHARRTGGAEPALEAGSGFDVILTGFDPARKIACIQAVKDARESSGETPAGLAAAKTLVEGAPGVVCRGVSAPGAEEIRTALERAGGRVEIRRAQR